MTEYVKQGHCSSCYIESQKCVANCEKCESIIVYAAISRESNDGSTWPYNGKRIWAYFARPGCNSGSLCCTIPAVPIFKMITSTLLKKKKKRKKVSYTPTLNQMSSVASQIIRAKHHWGKLIYRKFWSVEINVNFMSLLINLFHFC